MSLNSTSDEDSFSRVWRKGQRSSFPNSRSFTASLSRAFKPCTRERCWRRRHCIFVLRWSLFILASRHSSTERPLSMAMHAGQGSTTSTEVGKKTLENIYRGWMGFKCSLYKHFSHTWCLYQSVAMGLGQNLCSMLVSRFSIPFTCLERRVAERTTKNCFLIIHCLMIGDSGFLLSNFPWFKSCKPSFTKLKFEFFLPRKVIKLMNLWNHI